MISSGIRIGAWDYLRWKNVFPLSKEKEEIIAAKLKIYAGDSEEYYAFISPEVFYSLKEWMDFRCSYGEKINGDLIYTITNLNLILTH